MANANAATFDETNDYLTTGSGTDYSGNANSKLWSFAIWFALDSTPTHADLQALCFGANASYEIEIQTDGDIAVDAENSSGTLILSVDNIGTLITDTNYHCLLGSIDMAGSIHLYDGDTDLSPTINIQTDAAIDFTCSHTTVNHAIGGRASGARKFGGELGPFWMDFGQTIDFSIEANRRIFYGPNGKVPVALANSTDGDVGGLGQPIVFLNNGFATYQSNLGSGGGLTENGTLTAATGPEIEPANVIYRRRREMVGAF